MLSEGLGGDGFSKASKELSELEPVVGRIGDLRRGAARQGRWRRPCWPDPEMRALAEAELYELKDRLPALEQEIRLALLPKDEADARSAILEVRPAAGGDEAGLFAAELFQMYQKYAVTNGWRVEVAGLFRQRAGRDQGGRRRDHRAERVRAASNTRAACIGCSACRRPRARGGSIPRR